MANPALMVLPLDGSLQGRDRSGVFSAIGAGAVRYRPTTGARINWVDLSYPTSASGTGAAANGSLSYSATPNRGTNGSYKFVANGAGNGQFSMYNILAAAKSPLGTSWAFSFWVYAEASAAGRTMQVVINNRSGSGAEGAATGGTGAENQFTLVEGWQQFAKVVTTTLPDCTAMSVTPIILSPSSGDTFYVTEIQWAHENAVGSLIAGNWLDPVNGYLGSAGLIRRVSRAAAWLGEGTTNLVTNPWCSSNTTGWSATNGSIARTTLREHRVQGLGACQMTASGANATMTTSITAAATAHTTQWIVANEVNASRTFQLRYNGSDIGSPVVIAARSKAVLAAQFTGTGGAANLEIVCTDSASGNLYTVSYAGAEATAYATPPCPAINSGGTIQSGHAWTGTAHNSTSTRTAATITMDEAGRIDPVSGSLAFRYVRDIDTGTAEPILDVGEGTTGKDRLRVRVNSSDKLEVSWQSNGASETTLASTESITVGTEYWVYVAWSGTSVWVGIDGNALASGTRNAPQNNWGTTDLVVGTTAGSAGFGDLLIADRPLLPAERGAVRGRSPISMGVLAGAPYKHFQLRPY